MIKSRNNEYLKTMEPILYLMKLICALPLQLKPQNEISYFITSKLVYCISIVVYLIIHSDFGKHIIDLVIQKKLANIAVLVVKGPEIALELFCLAIPVLMWNKHKKMQDYWDSWKRFQMENEAITGIPFVSRKRRHIKIMALACLMSSIVRDIYAAWFYYKIYSGILNYIVNAYLILLIHIMATCWFANCAYFQSVSEDVVALGKKIISEKEDNSKVNRLVSMWLSLSDLVDQFNEAHSLLFLSFFLLIVVSLINYAYAFINYSTYEVIYPVTAYIKMLVIFSTYLLIICEASYSVQYQINFRQIEALLEENMMKIETSMLKSISRFLHTVFLRNPTVTLNGFVALNRVEILLVLSVSLNYLIILRQFSDNEDQENISN